jgi:hypothetical protein
MKTRSATGSLNKAKSKTSTIAKAATAAAKASSKPKAKAKKKVASEPTAKSKKKAVSKPKPKPKRKRAISEFELAEEIASDRRGEVVRVLSDDLPADVLGVVTSYMRVTEAEMVQDAMKINKASKQQKLDEQIRDVLPRELAVLARKMVETGGTRIEEMCVVLPFPELKKAMPVFHNHLAVLPRHGFAVISFLVGGKYHYAFFPAKNGTQRHKVRGFTTLKYKGHRYDARGYWTRADLDIYT